MKYILATFCFFVLSGTVMADSISGSLSLKTDYMATNGELICDKSVTQSNINYQATERLSFNLWASTDKDSSNPSCGKEVDYTASLAVSDELTVMIGYYDIGKVGDTDIDISTIKVTNQFGNFTTWIQYTDPNGNDYGIDLKTAYQIDNNWSAGLNLGTTPFAQKSYVIPSIAYSYSWGDFSLSGIVSHALTGAENQKNNIVFGVAYSF